MSERQKETRFLKTLIFCDESDQARHLQERIRRAEKDERCIRGAVYLVSLVALLALCGLGYSAVFVPQFTHFSSHIATRICCDIGLGSLICVVIFVAYWLWYRAVSNRAYEDCRRFLRPLLESHLKQGSPSPAFPAQTSGSEVYTIETRPRRDGTEFLQLSKAS